MLALNFLPPNPFNQKMYFYNNNITSQVFLQLSRFDDTLDSIYLYGNIWDYAVNRFNFQIPFVNYFSNGVFQPTTFNTKYYVRNNTITQTSQYIPSSF